MLILGDVDARALFTGLPLLKLLAALILLPAFLAGKLLKIERVTSVADPDLQVFRFLDNGSVGRHHYKSAFDLTTLQYLNVVNFRP